MASNKKTDKIILKKKGVNLVVDKKMTVLISLLNHIAFKGALSQKYKQYSCRRKKIIHNI